MDDGLAEGAAFGTLLVDVNPLVVERGVGKGVDTVLIYLQPVGFTEFLTYVFLKFFV